LDARRTVTREGVTLQSHNIGLGEVSEITEVMNRVKKLNGVGPRERSQRRWFKGTALVVGKYLREYPPRAPSERALIYGVAKIKGGPTIQTEKRTAVTYLSNRVIHGTVKKEMLWGGGTARERKTCALFLSGRLAGDLYPDPGGVDPPVAQ